MAAKGMYFWLKDATVPLGDRLKVVRFSWVSDAVPLPNKHQVLLDLVTGFLVNKKKLHLKEQDCQNVWCCLDQILHAPLPTKDPPILKPSFCQVVLDALHSCLNEKTGVSYEVIARCCSAVLASPALADTFALRFDFLAQLLSVLSQLGVQELQKGGQLELWEVVCQVADALTKCQRSQTNLKQVLLTTLDQLLAPLLALRHLASKTPSLQACLVPRLEAILVSSLLSRDQTPYYKAYLQAALEEEGEEGSKAKAGKLTETFFLSLTDLLQGKSPAKFALLSSVPWKQASQSFLVVFYREFSSAVSQDAVLCHKMLVLLCRMLKLVVVDAASDGEGSHDDDGCLATLQRMLGVVRSQELYNVADDKASGFKQLFLFRTLVSSLLKLPRNSLGLVCCLLELLRLNHAILEPKIAAVLQLTWLLPDSEQGDTPLPGAEEFLSELVATYAKLRQLPKLTSFLLTSVLDSSGHTRAAHTALFYSKYGEVVAQLPQGSCFDMWQSFLDQMSSLCPSLSGDGSPGVCKLWCLCGIFEKLLQNLRVSPDALTEPSISRMAELMDKTDSAVLRPLFEAALQNKENDLLLSASLLLAYRWGELRIPLALCGAGRAGLEILPALVSHPHDLTLVLPMLSAKQWTRLHKCVVKAGNCRLQFLWDLLSVQKVRAAMLFISDQDGREATLSNMAECALQMPEIEKASSLTAAWDGLVRSVDGDTYLVARWWLLTTNWGHLFHLASHQHLAAIAHLAVQSLSPASLADQSRSQGKDGVTQAGVSDAAVTEGSVTCDSVTCDSVTRKFLASTAIEGGAALFSALVSALWDLVAMETTSTPTSKAKKMKRSPGTVLLHRAWTLLAQRDGGRLDQTNGETGAGAEETIPEEVGSAILDLLELWPLTDVTLPHTMFPTVFQVLASIHFESLVHGDQLRCILGMLAAVLALTSDLKRGTEVVEQAVARLGEVVVVGGHASVFHCVPPTALLQWCLRLMKQVRTGDLSSHLGEKVKGLVQTVCHTLTWDAEALRQALPCVEQLKSEFAPITPGKRKKMKTKKTQSKEDGAGGLCESPHLVLTSCLLQQLHKSLGRGYLPEGLREECEKLFKMLAEPVALQLGSLGQRQTLLPPSAVSCAQTLLQRRRLAAEREGMETDGMTETPAFLPVIFKQVLGQLETMSQSGVVQISVEECNSLLACLQFIQAVCRSKSFLPSILSQDSVSRCWSVCQNLHTLLLHSQSFLPETLDLQPPSDCSLRAEMLESSRNAKSGMEINGGVQISNGGLFAGDDTSGIRKSSRLKKSPAVSDDSMEVDGEEMDHGRRNSLIKNGFGLSSHAEKESGSNVMDSTPDSLLLVDGVSRRINVVLSLLQEQVAHFGQQPSKQTTTTSCWQKIKKPSTTSFTTSAVVDTGDRPGGSSVLALHSLRGSGSPEDRKRGEVVEYLQTTLVDVLCACNPELFQSILESLQHRMMVGGARQSVTGLLSSLQMWRILAMASLPETLAPLRTFATKSVMRELQQLALALQGLEDRELSVTLTVPILELLSVLISKGKTLMSGRCALLSLCTVTTMRVRDLSYEAVVAVCEAVYAVLNALLVHHPTHTLDCLPAFLRGLHKLLELVVDYGSQERLSSNPTFTDRMVSCSHLLTRLLSLLCSHKTEVCKVSTYVLASYTALVQHVTLLPAVKRAMSAGLYCLLDACDKFGIAQLFATLPVGPREIFRSLHSDYSKYHKFKGRI